MTRSEAERTELISAYEASGQSIVEFSRARGIDPSYMYSLKRRRRDRPGFVRVGAESTVTIFLTAPELRIEAKVSELGEVLRQLGVRR